MNVDTFFEKYPDVIENMTMQKGNKVVNFLLGINNIIPEDNVPKNMEIQQLQSTQNAYHLRIITKDYTFEEICDFIDEIMKFNEELERKKELFKEKKEELEKIFNDYDLEDLKTLKFQISEKTETTTEEYSNVTDETQNSSDKEFMKHSNNAIDHYNNKNGKKVAKDDLK